MSVLLYDAADGIATITLNRPERMNALNPDLMQAIQEAFIRFRDDAAARVAILTGAGDRAFSAGADLRAFDDRAQTGAPTISEQPQIGLSGPNFSSAVLRFGNRSSRPSTAGAWQAGPNWRFPAIYG